jgi:hypothetical protein
MSTGLMRAAYSPSVDQVNLMNEKNFTGRFRLAFEELEHRRMLSVYTPTTAAEIIAAINSRAVAGDEVLLPTGVFDCRAATLTPRPGVQIVGPGQSACSIWGAWIGDLQGSAHPLVLQDFTMDATGIAANRAAVLFKNGTVELDRVTLHGPTVSCDVLTFATSTAPTIATMHNCVFHTAPAGYDIVSTEAATAAYAPLSRLTLYDCEGYDNATGNSDQWITAHDNFPLYDYNGYYHDPVGWSPIAAGAGSTNGFTRLELHGTRIYGGRITNVTLMDGCYDESTRSESYAVLLSKNMQVLNCTFVIKNSMGMGTLLAGLQTDNDGSDARIENCFIDLQVPGVTGVYVYSGATDLSLQIYGLRTRGGGHGIYVDAGTGPQIEIENSIIEDCTWNSIVVTNLGHGEAVVGDYNVLQGDPANYTLGPHDILAAPQLDPDGTPTLGGNCDGTGNASLDLVSAVDLYGRPRTRPGNVISRGPVEPLASPSVSSLTPNLTTVADANVGTAAFALTIVFNEAMNTTLPPTIAFPGEDPSGTLRFNAGSSGWSNSTTYVARYDVVDLNATLLNVDVYVTGAADVAGDAQTPRQFVHVFNIDMQNPTVTINQAVGQADPTHESPVNFTVVFSEAVSDFATGEVTLSGSAGPTAAMVTNPSGDRRTYNVAVSGLTGSGTVVATLAAEIAHDAAGNASTAATSTDNTVTYIAPRIWDGGGTDDNWKTAANWVGDVAPVAGDRLIFAGTTRTSPFNDFADGTFFDSIVFDNGDFALSGGAVILSPQGGVAIDSVAGYNSIALPLTLAPATTGTTIVEAGTLELAFSDQSLVLGGKVDIRNTDSTVGKLILDVAGGADPTSTIRQHLLSGLIHDSAASTFLSNGGLVTLGYFENGSLLTIKPMLAGDASGDGGVDGADFTALRSNWGATSGATWATGDFSFDGAVDGADFTLLRSNWGKTWYPAETTGPASFAGQSASEPSVSSQAVSVAAIVSVAGPDALAGSSVPVTSSDTDKHIDVGTPAVSGVDQTVDTVSAPVELSSPVTTSQPASSVSESQPAVSLTSEPATTTSDTSQSQTEAKAVASDRVAASPLETLVTSNAVESPSPVSEGAGRTVSDLAAASLASVTLVSSGPTLATPEPSELQSQARTVATDNAVTWMIGPFLPHNALEFWSHEQQALGTMMGAPMRLAQLFATAKPSVLSGSSVATGALPKPQSEAGPRASDCAVLWMVEQMETSKAAASSLGSATLPPQSDLVPKLGISVFGEEHDWVESGYHAVV